MAYAGRLAAGDGQASACAVSVTEEAVQIDREGSPLALALVDIDVVRDEDYTLRLQTADGTTYALSQLGRAYGQVLADLRKARDAALERALLLRGVGLTDTYPGKLVAEGASQPVELRVYEDLLVVVPEQGTMFGIPFSFIDDVAWDADAYQVVVSTDDGETLRFGHLAKRSEEFLEELRRMLGALAARTRAMLEQLVPGLDGAALSGLAPLLRDGRAAQQRGIEAVAPGAWPRLEDAVAGTDALRASYEHLRTLSPPGWTAFGIKAVARAPEDGGAESSEAGAPPGQGLADLWFFAPLARDGEPVNALAQEVTSESGHATYLFRLMEPEEFARLRGDALADEVTRAIARLNRALLLLNFRREPIMLPDERMTGPDARYRVAMRKLPYLHRARAAFLGRAIHNAGWEKQVAEILARA